MQEQFTKFGHFHGDLFSQISFSRENKLIYSNVLTTYIPFQDEIIEWPGIFTFHHLVNYTFSNL